MFSNGVQKLPVETTVLSTEKHIRIIACPLLFVTDVADSIFMWKNAGEFLY